MNQHTTILHLDSITTLTRTEIVVAKTGFNHLLAELSPNNGKICCLEEPLWSYQKDCDQLKSSWL